MDQGNQFDLIWIFNVIWRRKWMIIGLLALALLVSGAVMIYQPPVYKASATLMIEPSEKSTASEYSVLMAGERLALTYSQIIVSRPVLDQVIEELGINVTVSQLERMITVQSIKDTHLLRISAANVSPIWAVKITNSLAEKFIAYVDTLAAESYNQSLSYTQQSIDLKQGEIDGVLSEIESKNSQDAELEISLSELELRLAENRDDYQTLQQNSQTLESSITQYTNKIHIIEPAYIESAGMTPPYTALLLLFFDQDILTGNLAYTDQVSDLIAQIYGPMLLRDALLEQVAIQLEINISPETMREGISVATIPGTQFLELRVSDNDASQAVQVANTIASVFIQQNQSSLAEPYNDRLQTIELEMEQLTTQMEEIQNEIKSLSASQTAVELELERLTTELTTKYSDRRELQNTYDQLVFEVERSANTIVISEPAVQPKKQSQNSILYIGLSAIIACAIGAGLAFLLEHIEDKVRTQEDILSLLNQKPIGLIGHIEKGKDKLILGPNASPFVAEDFRKLSAIIRPAIEGAPLHKLLITSPGPGEGKSTVASNLAIALAGIGTRVILVDADLHRPKIQFLFDLENDKGLTESISSNRKITPLKQTPYPNLQILTSGEPPEDASQTISSPKLGYVLDTLASKADLVIIDCPPILTFADASFLNTLVDGVLLVINSGSTDRKTTVEAVALLRNAKNHFMGVVLNNVATQPSSYYRYYDQEHK